MTVCKIIVWKCTSYSYTNFACLNDRFTVETISYDIVFIYHKQFFSFLVGAKSTDLLQYVDTKRFVIYEGY